MTSYSIHNNLHSKPQSEMSVFPKQCDLKPLDKEMEKNMQKITTIVHICLKIKEERTSEKETI